MTTRRAGTSAFGSPVMFNRRTLGPPFGVYTYYRRSCAPSAEFRPSPSTVLRTNWRRGAKDAGHAAIHCDSQGSRLINPAVRMRFTACCTLILCLWGSALAAPLPDGDAGNHFRSEDADQAQSTTTEQTHGTVQQEPSSKSKPKMPAEFVPSEKISADKAVSFPSDI